jgi:hypothetical protein
MTWKVELSEEVRGWYDALSGKNLAMADRAINRLKRDGNMLGCRCRRRWAMGCSSCGSPARA